MKILSTLAHGIEDYLMVILLLAGPALFGFTDPAAATIFRAVGVVLLLLSLMTRYELGLIKAVPMKAHIAMDAIAALLLIVSPWLFGFNDEPARTWAPFVILGAVILLSGMMTRTDPMVTTLDQDAEAARSARHGRGPSPV